MSAMVEEVVRQRAECDDCGWKGPVRKSHRRALDDAQDHDEEAHNPWRTDRTIGASGGDAGAIGTGNSPMRERQDTLADGDGMEDPSTPPRSTPRHPNRTIGASDE